MKASNCVLTAHQMNSMLNAFPAREFVLLMQFLEKIKKVMQRDSVDQNPSLKKKKRVSLCSFRVDTSSQTLSMTSCRQMKNTSSRMACAGRGLNDWDRNSWMYSTHEWMYST